jgi:hypothetical protein
MQTTIQQAIDEASEWMKLKGIEGVGQGEKDGKECIIVFASATAAELAGVIPSTFKGFPVVIEETGIISAL